eukprot:gene8687-7091_t
MRISVPGNTLDSNLALWALALTIPAVRKGQVLVVYDAQPPCDLIMQVVRSLPHGAFAALYGKYGARLALIHAALLDGPAEGLSAFGIKASSHTSGYANGRADGLVTNFRKNKHGKWIPLQGCRALRAWAWPIQWKGLHANCPDVSPRYTLRNWGAAL